MGAFLSNRIQMTDTNGVHSIYVDANSCVLQGSVLGPMLLLHINELNHAITSQIKLFAYVYICMNIIIIVCLFEC